jgi:hypothetical protein
MPLGIRLDITRHKKKAQRSQALKIGVFRDLTPCSLVHCHQVSKVLAVSILRAPEGDYFLLFYT